MDVQNGPYFSVVVAAHNRGKFIQRALRSVVDQTIFRHSAGQHPMVEVTIVDDESTDDTKNTVKKFIDRHKNPAINWFYCSHSQNLGVTNPKNAGIDVALAEWVVFLDPEDMWEPHHLEHYQGAIMGNPSVDLFYSTPVVLGNREIPNQGTTKIDDTLDNTLDVCVRREVALKHKFKTTHAHGHQMFLDVSNAGYVTLKLGTLTYIYDHGVRTNRHADIHNQITKQ
jgi:glycosyltransferase involved in cell wall biosynthesis